MEETISLIIHGCKLAKDLESNLPNLANQPNILSNSCDEIIKVFSNASERLNAHEPTSYPYTIYRELQESQPSQIEVGVREWLTSSYAQAMGAQAMGALQTQLLAKNHRFDMRGLPESKMGGIELREPGLEVPVTELGGRVIEGSTKLRGSGGEFQATGASGSGKSKSSSQRSRRRKDDVEKWMVRVAAPQIGNTEMPPEDGHTWRKYGQKEILGSRFLRGYYRCTHQKTYQCSAKKQVQRLDDDPHTFEVTYRGEHTCHMSATAPSSVPLLPAEITQEMTQLTTTTQHLLSTSVPRDRWLSMEFRSTGEGTNAFIDSQVQMYRDFSLGGAGSSNSSSMVGTDVAGPSTVRSEKEAEDHPVVDLADAMFNSGSTTSNSMDLIFSFMDDKWEPSVDRKNN